jgi:hypothetical protein
MGKARSWLNVAPVPRGTLRSASTSTTRRAACGFPVHVIAFAEHVQAPPKDGDELARLIPAACFHLLDGMGHGSRYGQAHDFASMR